MLGYAGRVPTEITEGIAVLGDALRELGADQSDPDPDPAAAPGLAAVSSPEGARTAPT